MHQHRLLDPDHRAIFAEGFLVFRGILLDADPVARGVADDFVIDVSDVHHVADLVSALAKKALQKIDRDERAKVADMPIVIHRRPAGVHADFVVHERMEFFNPRGHGVVKTKRHRSFREERRTYDSRGIFEMRSNRRARGRCLFRKSVSVCP